MNYRTAYLVIAFSLFVPSGILAAWPGQPWLTGCARWIQGTDWNQAYQHAHQKGEVRNGAIALARLISLHGKAWNLHPQSQAHFARAAEVLSLKAVRIQGDGFAEYSYRFRDSRRSIDHVRGQAKFWLKEFAWASAPFFFRPGHLRGADAEFIAFLVRPTVFWISMESRLRLWGFPQTLFLIVWSDCFFPRNPRIGGLASLYLNLEPSFDRSSLAC